MCLISVNSLVERLQLFPFFFSPPQYLRSWWASSSRIQSVRSVLPLSTEAFDTGGGRKWRQSVVWGMRLIMRCGWFPSPSFLVCGSWHKGRMNTPVSRFAFSCPSPLSPLLAVWRCARLLAKVATRKGELDYLQVLDEVGVVLVFSAFSAMARGGRQKTVLVCAQSFMSCTNFFAVHFPLSFRRSRSLVVSRVQVLTQGGTLRNLRHFDVCPCTFLNELLLRLPPKSDIKTKEKPANLITVLPKKRNIVRSENKQRDNIYCLLSLQFWFIALRIR